MTQPSRRKAATPAHGMTAKEQALIDSLVKERNGAPQRVIEELDRVRDGLKTLVDAKVPIRDILSVFIKGLNTRVTSAQARSYLREHFDYPTARVYKREKVAAKKAPASAKTTGGAKAASKSSK